MIIRPMRPDDLDQVLALAASLQQAPQWPPTSYLAALNPHNTPQRIVLVAEAASSIQGFAVASLLLPQSELESIAVAIPVQRRGIASLLLQALIEQLQTAGATELTLEVRLSNHHAEAFYRRSGFLKIGHRPRYYQHPSEDASIFKLIFRENDVRL